MADDSDFRRPLEILGDICDERDPTPPIARPADGGGVARGHTPLADVEDYGLATADREATSIGGLVMNRLGRPAAPGDVVEEAGLRIGVREARGARVITVEPTPLTDEGEEPT